MTVVSWDLNRPDLPCSDCERTHPWRDHVTATEAREEREEGVIKRKHWRVEVEWSDSQVIGGSWEPIGDLLKRRESVRCFSVGYVLADDKRGIVLAASINGSNATGVTIIPASQVTNRRRLR